MKRLSIVLATASSLPGIGEAETITVSPGSIVMLRWSRLLIRVSPLIGSPWEPGGHHHQLLLGQALELVLLDQRAVAGVEVAALERDRRVLLHAAAEGDHLAAVRPGGVDHLLDAADVAGEGGDDDAPLRLADQPVEALPDRRLGERVALLLGPGRVGQQELDAPVADLGDQPQVGTLAVRRRVVELEVTGVDDRADTACGSRSPRRRGSSG